MTSGTGGAVAVAVLAIVAVIGCAPPDRGAGAPGAATLRGQRGGRERVPR